MVVGRTLSESQQSLESTTFADLDALHVCETADGRVLPMQNSAIPWGSIQLIRLLAHSHCYQLHSMGGGNGSYQRRRRMAARAVHGLPPKVRRRC